MILIYNDPTINDNSEVGYGQALRIWSSFDNRADNGKSAGRITAIGLCCAAAALVC
ncbi:hypothetical protein D3C80_2099790 [compost metagenome]